MSDLINQLTAERDRHVIGYPGPRRDVAELLDKAITALSEADQRVKDARRVALEEAALWHDAKVQDVAGLPQDVIDLVIAAREFWDIHNDMERESNALDKALEKFASRVPFEDANLIDRAAPAKQEG